MKARLVVSLLLVLVVYGEFNFLSVLPSAQGFFRIGSNDTSGSEATVLYGGERKSSGYDARYLVFLFIAALLFGPKLRSIFFDPLYIRRDPTNVEIENDSLAQMERKNTIFKATEVGRPQKIKMRNYRKPGQTPPPYPNAWYRILSSEELSPGQCVDVQMLGQVFVVFRSEDGEKVSCLDAYCPHMGANLAVNGEVVKDTIKCAFHGWRFDSQGTCVDIPYADKVPAFAKTKKYTTVERNRMIFIWFDAEGREPSWYPPEVPEITKRQYRLDGMTEHKIRCHISEIPENGPDTGHLNVLHTQLTVKTLGLHKLLNHYWEASWKAGRDAERTPEQEEEDLKNQKGSWEGKHLAHIMVYHRIQLLKSWQIPGLSLDVSITQVGPGLVFLHFTTLFGILYVIETVTPVTPMLQLVTHQVFAQNKVPRWFGKVVLTNLVTQFEKDVPVWNNKTYLNNPLIIKEDGDILKFRRWFTQFYSENSRNVGKDICNDW